MLSYAIRRNDINGRLDRGSDFLGESNFNIEYRHCSADYAAHFLSYKRMESWDILTDKNEGALSLAIDTSISSTKDLQESYRDLMEYLQGTVPSDIDD